MPAAFADTPADHWREAHQDEIRCFFQPMEDASLRELSFLEKNLNKFLQVDNIVSKSKQINPLEKLVLKKYPDLGILLGNVRCRAQMLAVTVCDVDLSKKNAQQLVQDEEADALRHFFFTFMIASAKGVEVARFYTTAHEGDPAGWTDRELMDVKNNSVAIAVYEEMARAGARPKFSDPNLVALGLSLLKQGRLTTLEKGKTRCADSAIFTKAPKELLKKSIENYRSLEKFSSCKLPMGIF